MILANLLPVASLRDRSTFSLLPDQGAPASLHRPMCSYVFRLRAQDGLALL